MARHRKEEDERFRRLMLAKEQRDVGYLVESLTYDPHRAELPAKWLGDWGATEATPSLIRLLSSPHADTRRAVVHALGRLGPPPEVRDALIELARSDPDPPVRWDPPVRCWACSALGGYEDAALVPILVAALDDADWRVRVGAAAALGQTGDAQAVAPLRRGLRRLRRNPFLWYLSRLAYKHSLTALAKRQ